MTVTASLEINFFTYSLLCVLEKEFYYWNDEDIKLSGIFLWATLYFHFSSKWRRLTLSTFSTNHFHVQCLITPAENCRLWGPKSVRSGDGLPLLTLRHIVSLLVSMPLRIVNRCWSCSCKWRYINDKTFNLLEQMKYLHNSKTKWALLSHFTCRSCNCLFLQTEQLCLYWSEEGLYDTCIYGVEAVDQMQSRKVTSESEAARKGQ